MTDSLFIPPNILDEDGAADAEAEVVGVEAVVGCFLKRSKDGAAVAPVVSAEVVDVEVVVGCLLYRLKDGAAVVVVVAVGAEEVDVEASAGCFLNILKGGAVDVAIDGAAEVLEVPPVLEVSFGAGVKIEDPEDCIVGALVEF